MGRAPRRRRLDGRATRSCRRPSSGASARSAAHVRDSLAAWQLRVPQIRATWDALAPLVRPVGHRPRRAADARRRASGIGLLPAAGMPWFMTVFGRDTLITCLQTLLFGPELARAALRCSPSSRRPRTTPRSTPSRARSSTRCAAARRRRTGSRATTARSTRRRSSSSCSPRSGAGRTTRRSCASSGSRRCAALEWIDEYGDRDGDGFVEFERRSPRGLENQSWKDSGDSQRFADGTLAQAPIAPCEVQGYVYDAKLRMAELAREVWRDARARRAARARGGRAERALRRGVLGRGARRLLRARARRRQAAGRLALLEHRPPALVAGSSPTSASTRSSTG